MTFKMPENRDEFLSLAPIQRIVAIANALEESADRCENNMITEGTWIESTFRQAANDLHAAALMAAVDREFAIASASLKAKP